jgi:glycosyltransferase involved in cell wall biosynthesis
VIDAGGTLLVAGQGDVLKKLKGKWNSHPDIEIMESVSSKLVPSLLEKSDVGLLPMPDKRIWNIASPLKLVEYAASGLLVAGIDHEGNRPEIDAEWIFLAESMEEAIAMVLDEYSNIELRQKAREDAIQHFDWNSSAQIIENSLTKIITSRK